MAQLPIQIGLPLDVSEPDALTPQPHHERRTTIGRSSVAYIQTKSILTESSGFMSEYDYTLNPYSGCTFGCTYCYAAFFVRDQAKQDSWGQWVQVKENALTLLRRKRNDPLDGKRIYMSSVTDPYQPIERNLELTRTILEELLTYHQPRLVIQTRSPIVVRDIDLLQRFATVQVNMTITTDDEQIRKVFEPTCSSIKARFEAITRIQQAGIPACITMTRCYPSLIRKPSHNGSSQRAFRDSSFSRFIRIVASLSREHAMKPNACSMSATGRWRHTVRCLRSSSDIFRTSAKAKKALHQYKSALERGRRRPPSNRRMQHNRLRRARSGRFYRFLMPRAFDGNCGAGRFGSARAITDVSEG
jgi:DNA repair photolyase